MAHYVLVAGGIRYVQHNYTLFHNHFLSQLHPHHVLVDTVQFQCLAGTIVGDMDSLVG